MTLATNRRPLSRLKSNWRQIAGTQYSCQRLDLLSQLQTITKLLTHMPKKNNLHEKKTDNLLTTKVAEWKSQVSSRSRICSVFLQQHRCLVSKTRVVSFPQSCFYLCLSVLKRKACLTRLNQKVLRLIQFRSNFFLSFNFKLTLLLEGQKLPLIERLDLGGEGFSLLFDRLYISGLTEIQTQNKYLISTKKKGEQSQGVQTCFIDFIIFYTHTF